MSDDQTNDDGAEFDHEKGAVVGKRKAGAPGKFTPERMGYVLVMLRAGLSRNQACQLARVNKSGFIDYVKKNPSFKAEIHAAELDCVANAAKALTEAAADPKNWKASLEVLRRRDPKRWGDHTEVTIARKGGTSDAEAAMLTKLGMFMKDTKEESEAAPDAVPPLES